MKKRYVILAALLVTALAAAGCGKKQTEDTGKDGHASVYTRIDCRTAKRTFYIAVWCDSQMYTRHTRSMIGKAGMLK